VGKHTKNAGLHTNLRTIPTICHLPGKPCKKSRFFLSILLQSFNFTRIFHPNSQKIMKKTLISLSLVMALGTSYAFATDGDKGIDKKKDKKARTEKKAAAKRSCTTTTQKACAGQGTGKCCHDKTAQVVQ
jgi:hypothetical protein